MRRCRLEMCWHHPSTFEGTIDQIWLDSLMVIEDGENELGAVEGRLGSFRVPEGC